VAVLAIAAAIRLDRSGVRTLSLGVASVIYPAILASAFFFGMHDPENPVGRLITAAPPVEQSLAATPRSSPDPARSATFDVHRTTAKTIAYVLGTGRLPMAALGLLLWGWWCSPEREVRKFHLCFAAFFAAVWVNPFLIEIIVSSVTGGDTYWRVFWTLPLPMLGAFFLTSPVVRLRWRWGSVFTMVLVIVVLIGVRSAPVYGGPKGARFGPPTLKVPAEYAVARALVERVPPGSAVVAPRDVAAWVTTFHHHPFPVVVRRHYLHHIIDAVGGDETLLRLQATIAVTKPGRSRTIDARLLELVDDRSIAGIVIAIDGFKPGRLEKALRTRGYSAEWSDERYRIWVNDQPSSRHRKSGQSEAGSGS
jgi:hypothetical protein